MSDLWYTAENGSIACEHGHQRRKCPHCESIWQDKRITELEEENKRLRDALKRAKRELSYGGDSELLEYITDILETKTPPEIPS